MNQQMPQGGICVQNARFSSMHFLSLLDPSWCRLNVCVSPYPHSLCTVLIHSVWWWDGGAFEKWLGHEGKALVNGSSALIKGPRELPCPFSHVRTQRSCCLSVNQGGGVAGEGSHRHWICQSLNLGLPVSRGARNKCLLFIRPSLWYSAIAGQMD